MVLKFVGEIFWINWLRFTNNVFYSRWLFLMIRSKHCRLYYCWTDIIGFRKTTTTISAEMSSPNWWCNFISYVLMDRSGKIEIVFAPLSVLQELISPQQCCNDQEGRGKEAEVVVLPINFYLLSHCKIEPPSIFMGQLCHSSPDNQWHFTTTMLCAYWTNHFK